MEAAAEAEGEAEADPDADADAEAEAEADAETDEEMGEKKPNLDNMIDALDVATMKEILGIGKNTRVFRRDFYDFFYGHDDRILKLQAAYEKHLESRRPSSALPWHRRLP